MAIEQVKKSKHHCYRFRFCGNLELCSWALSDAFVGDSFVCIEVRLWRSWRVGGLLLPEDLPKNTDFYTWDGL